MTRSLIATLAVAALIAVALPVRAFTFTAIHGAPLPLDAWRGQPVLVVNTASLCGFTRQYGDMQALHDRFAARGLVVLAVPSDDFNQELASNEAVADFCRIQLSLDIPITEITPVTGAQAHPFYQWLAREHGHRPRWNFNKALIGPEGEVLGFWGSRIRPTDRRITRLIEEALRG